MLAQPQKKTWMWIVVAVIALLVLLFALYTYYSGDYSAPEGTAGVDDVEILGQDLQAVETEGLDSGLNDIEKELVQ